MARSPLPDDIRRVEWLPPWVATADRLEVELSREIGKGHPLEGRPAVAIARRTDQDGVLFWLPAGPGAVASVHLTWRGTRERHPQFPWTQVYDSLEAWVEQEMRFDHAAYCGGDDDFVPEEAIDYDAIFARGGRNLGDEDFAFFKCPRCHTIYLLEYEVDTVYLDSNDLTKRAEVANESFRCVGCGEDVARGGWAGPRRNARFQVTWRELKPSAWAWAAHSKPR